MKLKYNENINLVISVDEVARGCLFGDVMAGACILPDDLPEDEIKIIKDSKLYKNHKQRAEAYEYIINNAISWGVGSETAEYIDKYGIIKACMSAMHKAIRNTNISPEHIEVDGTYFTPYYDKYGYVNYTTIIDGDFDYYNIAAGSVVAKYNHDIYIQNICKQYPQLHEIYDIANNQGYGSKNHCDAIKKYGITQFHRKTFATCKNQPLHYL